MYIYIHIYIYIYIYIHIYNLLLPDHLSEKNENKKGGF